VHAHPDDEASKGAATIAKYVAEGVDVMIATCTGGERGDVLNPKLKNLENEKQLAEIRNKEMQDSIKILGAKHTWLGHIDSGWPDGEPKPPLPPGCFAEISLEEAARPLIKLIREFRPQVLITYDENGGYPHPDHIRCHEITMFAYEHAGRLNRFPELGTPWQPLKVYYQMSFNYQHQLAIQKAFDELNKENPFAKWFEDTKDDTELVTTKIHCAEYFGKRDLALLAHATQVDPDDDWFALPTEVAQRTWPTEDYHLAITRVATKTPETDLFAGLR
jgi:mycothiol S-conjugate amidase